MHFYGTATINDIGNLEIGGVDAVELAQEYGTPLYVYDVALIRERAKALNKHLMKKSQSSSCICE